MRHGLCVAMVTLNWLYLAIVPYVRSHGNSCMFYCILTENILYIFGKGHLSSSTQLEEVLILLIYCILHITFLFHI